MMEHLESGAGPSFDQIYKRILEVAPGLHSAGTLSPRALSAIVEHAKKRRILHSAETGCGASTLLFSHLSPDHTVFALDGGSGSIANVRASPLLRASAVTFVEGSTQAMLPRHQFADKLQAVLIDGPHAYPFPDLEYYFLYPNLDTGALLILDDIHIRSIHNLFEFLRKDAMFRLEEVTDKTAFFTRTAAPTFDPFGDGWWTQSYNTKLLATYVWREQISARLPKGFRSQLSRFKRRLVHSRGCAVKILAPDDGAVVSDASNVEGSATLPAGAHLWVLVHRKDVEGWWPQGQGPVSVDQGRWSVAVTYGGPQDAGYDFEVAAVAVGPTTNESWTRWVRQAKEASSVPPVRLPDADYLLQETYRTVRKRR